MNAFAPEQCKYCASLPFTLINWKKISNDGQQSSAECNSPECCNDELQGRVGVKWPLQIMHFGAVQDQALGGRTTHMYSKACETHSEKWGHAASPFTMQ